MAENVETILEFPETLRTKENDFVYLGKTTAEDGNNDTKLDVNGGLTVKETDIGTGETTIDLSDEAYNRNYLAFNFNNLSVYTKILLDNIDLYKGKKISFVIQELSAVSYLDIYAQKSTGSELFVYKLEPLDGVVHFYFDGVGNIKNKTREFDINYIESPTGKITTLDTTTLTANTLTTDTLEATTSVETDALVSTSSMASGTVIGTNFRYVPNITSPFTGALYFKPLADTVSDGDLLKYDSATNTLSTFDILSELNYDTITSSSMTDILTSSTIALEVTYTKAGLVSLKGTIITGVIIESTETDIVSFPVSLPSTVTDEYSRGNVYVSTGIGTIESRQCTLHTEDTIATLSITATTADPINLGSTIYFSGLTMQVFHA